MKSLKSVLTAIAFVFAIGAAYAIDSSISETAVSFKTSSGVCIPAQMPGACSLNGPAPCEVTEFNGLQGSFFKYDPSIGVSCQIQLQRPQ